MKPWKGEKFKT